MDAELWARARDLFERARELPITEQQPFVSSDAPEEPELAAQVLRMLESDRETSFLDEGFGAIVDDILQDSYGEFLGPYRRLRCLGEGGMGVVFLAEHIEWHTLVAIKVPRDAWISPEHGQRFADEQRTLAQLTHPGIARIYEGGTQPNGSPWFAMEYVDGVPITTFSANFDIRDLLALFRQACEAVHYAHSQTVIHRDLKPSNIFITPDGRVKLLDFGIARQIGEGALGRTRTGQQPYTLPYAAPEQISVNQISVQSDIYSLGVTLYELLTGRLPFCLAGLTPLAAEQMITIKPPTRPSAVSSLRLGKAEWADLDVLVLKAMHKDPDQRYRSVDALIGDINHFLKAEPLVARPDTTAYRVSKFLKRRRGPVLGASAALLLVIVLVGFFTWRLARSRDEALAQAKRARQIQQFMTDLFEGGDAVNGPSKDLRVVDMLAVGETTARKFDSDPLVQGDLYNTLGTVYQSFGDLNKAEPLLRRALARLTSAAGPRSKEVAETLMYISMLEDAQGHSANAEATARRALTIEKQLDPPDPPKLAVYQSALARILEGQARYGEALVLLNAAAPVLSEDPNLIEDWAGNLNLQTIVSIRTGDDDKAERTLRQVLEIDKRLHPVSRPDDAEDVMLLGEIADHRGRFNEAEQAYRRALAIKQSWFGQEHPEVADIRQNLAHVLWEQGKLTEGTAFTRGVLLDVERAYGPWHGRVAVALGTLSELACASHNLADARTYATREVDIDRKNPNDLDYPRALSNLADAYMAQNDHRSAESLYRQAVQAGRGTSWETSIRRKHDQFALAQIRASCCASQ